jgi:hypothetical protein
LSLTTCGLQLVAYNFFTFFSLTGLKPSDKTSPVVVSTTNGPVVLTSADLANATFQPVVTSADGGPSYVSTDFSPFDSPRPVSYSGDPYRSESDLYCTPSGEFGQRIVTSDGQFLPYQYKVAHNGAVGGGPANHINSPDSGIGDPSINASK